MATPSAPGVLEHVDEQSELVTGEAVALDLRPTGFVLRGAGAAIDFLLYFGTYILIVLVFSALATQLGLDQAVTTAVGVVALVLCVVVAPVAVETLSQGKSLGRLAVGARIVRDDGGAIGFRHALIRALTGVFEIFMTFGGGAAIIALFNGKGKRLGDLVAGTYSQHERVAKSAPATFGVPTALEEWSRTADVAKLPDPLARRVAQFLAQAAALTPDSRRRLARDLANETSAFVSPVPAGDPELFLAAVAVLRRQREAAALELERQHLGRLAPVLDGLPRGFPDRG
jgi:uncharacterized RDD family membrane protein YckC